MPVLVCADSSRTRRMVERALGAEWEVVQADLADVRVDRRDRDRIEAIVCACRSRRLESHVDALARLGREYPLVPLILVVDRDIEVVRSTSRLRINHIVWSDEVSAAALTRLIQAGLEEVGFAGMIGEIRRASLPPLLKRGVLLVLDSSRTPFRGVKDVADVLECSPITLSHELHDAVDGAFTFTDFLSAVQLLRARELRRTMSWDRAAADLGYSSRALRTKAKRLFGMTLRDMHATELRVLRRRFRQQLVAPFLAEETN